MRRVLTKQDQQAPPEFNEVLAKHNSCRLSTKYPILPGQDTTSSHQDKVQFAKARSQFITDCSNAVKPGVKNVFLSHQPITFAGAAVSPPQTSAMASTRALSGMASVPATNPPTSSAAAALADETVTKTAPPPSIQGGGGPGFSFGSAHDDEEIAKQLTDVGAMDM